MQIIFTGLLRLLNYFEYNIPFKPVLGGAGRFGQYSTFHYWP